MHSSSSVEDQHPAAREISWRRLESGAQVEVIILGGGVNGVSTFRDLCLNGVSAVLIDEKDFCAGASSASSRMAHGGLRYLESREFRLVKESARERNLLLRHARHCVKPLKVTVPVQTYLRGVGTSILRFVGFNRASAEMSLIALRGALFIYELMGRAEKILPTYRVTYLRHKMPLGLKPDTKALVSYFDGIIESPEGLIHEMLEESLDQHAASAAINHVTWAVLDGRITIKDSLTARSVSISPRVIVNAGGGSIDRINQRLNLETAYIRNVKGAHLVLSKPELSARMDGAAYYYDDGNSRMVIIIPIGETVLMGTTEIDTQDPLDKSISNDEIDYLLNSAASLFSDIPVSRNDIVALTTGLRPLQAGGQGDANSAQRDHRIFENKLTNKNSPIPVFSLAGGKWTTFRAFGESACDKVLAELERPRTVISARRDYLGAVDWSPNGSKGRAESVRKTALRTGLTSSRSAELWDRYGAIAETVADYCAISDDTAVAIISDYSVREIEWLILARGACYLDDLVLRRTNLVLSGLITVDTLGILAKILSATLGHDQLWADDEVKRCANMSSIIYTDSVVHEGAAA